MPNESENVVATIATQILSIDYDCCPDNWSVWLRFETCIRAVFLLVQVSMAVFLVVHGRKAKSFRQAFYLFFVATVVNCVLVLVVRRTRRRTVHGKILTHFSALTHLYLLLKCAW